MESFLLKNSVLSQQLYRNQNQQPLFQHQPFPTSQSSGSSSLKEGVPESGDSSKSQTQENCVTAETNKDTKTSEFWKDSEVQGTDFSKWEMPHASNKTSVENSQSNTNSAASTDSPAISQSVKDIFSGLPWKALSEEQHRKLNEQLLQEYKQRQRMLESRFSWSGEETKKLPVASRR